MMTTDAGVALLPPPESQIVTRSSARPVEMPRTVMMLRSDPLPREPVMTSDFVAGPVGVTDALGDETADQPAPLRARTVTVYEAPLRRPLIVHVVDVVMHERPPGVAVAW